MHSLSTNEISNWIAIYVATGICCVLALSLSVATVGFEVTRERAWRQIDGWRSLLLFGPKLWWRWQKRYLLSTPVTLSIVGWFAATLDWTS